MGEVCPPTAADYAWDSARTAKAAAKQNATELQSLRLEVQELRQALLQIFNAFDGAEGIPNNIRDYWWEKLANYPKVKE